MEDPKELHSTKIIFGLHCYCIRHKQMYTSEVPNPGEEKFYDAYDAAAYWCSQTQTGFGPDGAPVRPDLCQSGRKCCED